jgi:acyl dehydratase
MKYFEDLNVGDSWTSREHVVDEAEMVAYAQKYDRRSMHTEPHAAAKTPFGRVIASGGYLFSLAYLIGAEIDRVPGHEWAILAGLESRIRFIRPVDAGDRLSQQVTITGKVPKSNRGLVTEMLEMRRDNETVLSMENVLLMMMRPENY